MKKEVERKEIEITFEDQKKINDFSRINRRKNQNVFKIKQLEEEKNKLEDCLEELELSMEDHVDFNFAECFINLNTEEATELVEEKLTKIKSQISDYVTIKKGQMKELDQLKAMLYGKFGKSIQLEE